MSSAAQRYAFVELGSWLDLDKGHVLRIGLSGDAGRDSQAAVCSVLVKKILLEGARREYITKSGINHGMSSKTVN